MSDLLLGECCVNCGSHRIDFSGTCEDCGWNDLVETAGTAWCVTCGDETPHDEHDCCARCGEPFDGDEEEEGESWG